MQITSILATLAPPSAENQAPAAPSQQPFASLLRQSQAAKPALPPPPRPAPVPQPQGAAKVAEPAKTPEPMQAATAPQAQTQSSSKPEDGDAAARAANRQDGARSPDAEESQNRETDGERTEGRGAKPARPGDEAASPDALAQWLLGLQPQAGASGLGWPGGGRGGADGSNEAASDAASDAADAAQALGGSARQRLRTPGDDAARRADVSQQRSDALVADGSDAKLAHQAPSPDVAAAFVQLEKPERLFKPTAPEALHGAAIVGAATPSNSSPAPAAPAAVHLPTPLDAPDFAQALGAQLSVLAKDGVQRAELHLNPAEMGPVSVHIVMAGSHARIEFGADLAATRQILEAGLPELAGALRESGLTLTGGGVSQHSGQRGDGQAPEGGKGGDGLGAVEASAPRPLRRTVSAGGVDLYA